MNKKIKSYEKKRQRNGYLFILPWLVGCALFFIYPLIQAFVFAFQKIDLTATGLKAVFVGLENFRYAFLQDTQFVREWLGSIPNLIQVPLILIYSIFVAVLLKDKFKGRTIMRAVAFLPVIIGSGVLMEILKEDVFSKGIRGGETVYLFTGGGLDAILYELGLGETIITFINDVINRIFDLTWKSGVQIMLFLSGLHGIPGDVYEASSLEGARKWEQFWKVTLPMLTPTILLTTVYSVIDSFMDYGNIMVRMLYSTAFEQARYGYSSAISILYFLLVSAVLAIVYFFLRKKINYASS